MMRAKRLISGLLLLVYLVAGGLGGTGAQVLCHEPDGTTSIEFSFSRCCSTKESAAAPGGAPPGSASTESVVTSSDECIDTPVLSADQQLPGSDSSKHPVALKLVNLPFAIPTVSAALRPAVSPDAHELSLTSAAPTAQLSTVILRC